MKNIYLLVLILVITSCVERKNTIETIQLDALDINKMEQSTDRPMIGSRANIRIGNKKYARGVYTRCDSYLYVDLDRKGIEFSGVVGVDMRNTSHRIDTVNKKESSAIFYIYGNDGKELLYKSERIRYGEEAKKFVVNIDGQKNLLLEAIGEPGNTHVAWADTQIKYIGKKPRTEWSPDTKKIINQNINFVKAQNEKFPNPKINGAKRIGIRPNTPFHYKLPVTGMKPLSIEVKELPKGLIFNKENRSIEGVTSEKGEYNVSVIVSNDYGKEKSVLTIKIGDKLALAPPMGFLSWNVVEGLINEIQMKETADAFVALGLTDVGYQYLVIDDCWQGTRDKDGIIEADTIKFPKGMKAVGDYIHDKGLKFGIYSTPGPVTCAGYPGSGGYEKKDVETWCSWGVDYLKYDICSAGRFSDEKVIRLYTDMGNLLSTSERSIVYSVGAGDMGAEWGKKAKAHLWRTAGDVRDIWSLPKREAGIIECFERQFPKFVDSQEVGAWNDPDMLVAGIYGKGSSANDLNAQGCSDIEYQSQMSLWAMLSAPLFISADIRKISTKSLEILTNPEVISVNQDSLGKLPILCKRTVNQEIWMKELEDGTKAIALLNLSSVESRLVVNWQEIGLKGDYLVRDLWKRKDIGSFSKSFSSVIPSHGVTLIKVYQD